MANQQRNRNTAKVSMCVKYTMVFMNIVFFFLGGAILGFGIWGVYSKDISAITSVIESGSISVDPLWVFITIGCIVVVLSSVGCIGALRENTTLLNVFRYSMILILLLEVAAGVLGYFYQEEVIGSIENFVNRSMIDYQDDPDTQFIIDTIQDYLQCCGINEPKDWEVNKYYDCNGIAIVTKCGVPFSCCHDEEEGVVNYQCGNGALSLSTAEQSQIINTKGCKEAVITWLTSNLIFISIVVGSMVLLEIVALQLSVSLIGDIKWIKARW
ncbi:tetraspanin-5-like [Anneissia japonica]|uniref:tetraspanin-5-like n=1 Tax=Anneissia japonica TaxID=1529436 RepID=UPI0014254CA5|nr:tetraspanin-5-like [Anneissia japonica]XP_033124532.1 tetraspanin-5-like [Anneissia japonica]